MLMQAEKPRIRSDDAPPRLPRVGALKRTALAMSRGEWLMVSHAQARSMQRVVARLGGHATRYRTSDCFSVVKVLDAPWMNDSTIKVHS